MLKYFPILNLDLGTVIEDKKVKFDFHYENVGRIHRIMPSCDCTLAEANKKDSKIEVEWKPNKINSKLRAKGIKEVRKSVSMTVVYGPDNNPNGQHIVVLGFSAIVTSK